ncbi:MAG: zinc finger MYND domain-containing protein [Colwellia sp.]|nr:zinc finger MYND domain-containing protein [Colwellia sp.]
MNKLCLETCSFPSLVQKHPKKRKIFKKRIAKLVCFNCGSSGPGLRPCKGCLKTVYCSIKCQKIDWKYLHRMQCDRIWSAKPPVSNNNLYQLLKTSMGKFVRRIHIKKRFKYVNI